MFIEYCAVEVVRELDGPSQQSKCTLSAVWDILGKRQHMRGIRWSYKGVER